MSLDGTPGVSATPTYHAGHIYAAHVTDVVNGASQQVPGIQWIDIVPSLSTGYPASITGASVYQNGALNGSRTTSVATTFPVIMPDLDNDLILGYDYMGNSSPASTITSRRVSDRVEYHAGGLGIVESRTARPARPIPVGVTYEAMSYPATYQDFIWFGAQYSGGASDWQTELIKFRFNLNG